VHHSIKGVALKEHVERRAIPDIPANEGRTGRECAPMAIAEIVVDGNLVPGLQEVGRCSRADVACATGDENMHEASSS